MTGQWLSAEELYRLTGKIRFTAQRKVLTARKIPFKAASSGEPLVRRDWDLDASGRPEQRKGPRWDKIGSVRNLRP